MVKSYFCTVVIILCVLNYFGLNAVECSILLFDFLFLDCRVLLLKSEVLDSISLCGFSSIDYGWQRFIIKQRSVIACFLVSILYIKPI